MKLLNYLGIFAQFLFRHGTSFTFRLGPDKVSVLVEEVGDNNKLTPFPITFAEALYIVEYLITHHLNLPTYPFVESFFIDNQIEISVTVTKV